MVAGVAPNGAHDYRLTFPTKLRVMEPCGSLRFALRLQQHHRQCRHQDHAETPHGPVDSTGCSTRRIPSHEDLLLPELVNVLKQKPLNPIVKVKRLGVRLGPWGE